MAKDLLDATMHIQYVSDIHLERVADTKFEDVLTPCFAASESVLVLAGDIGCPYHARYREFLEHCGRLFKVVILVAGNHEYRSMMAHWKAAGAGAAAGVVDTDALIADVDAHLAKLCASVSMSLGVEGKVVYLRGGASHKVGDVNFIGATLWSPIPIETLTEADKAAMAAYLAPFATIEKNNELFKRDLAGLEKALRARNGGRNVVITHHCPFMQGAFKEAASVRNYLYAADLSQRINGGAIYAWIYGHTHWNVTTSINGTLVSSNQHGGDKKARRFTKEAVVAVQVL